MLCSRFWWFLFMKMQFWGRQVWIWSTSSFLSSRPFPISTVISSVISLEVYFVCGVHFTRFLGYDTGQFILQFLNQRAPHGLSFCQVCTSCCPSSDWLQQSHVQRKIGPVLSFPLVSSVASPQLSNSLWHGFELAHRENATRSILNCSCMACGCGCGLCLRQPIPLCLV